MSKKWKKLMKKKCSSQFYRSDVFKLLNLANQHSKKAKDYLFTVINDSRRAAEETGNRKMLELEKWLKWLLK